MVNITSLRQYQAGVQSAFGTAVAATAKLAIEELQLSPIDVIHRPRLAKGLAIGGVGNEFATRRGVTWVARGPFNYEQFQLWLAAAIDGSVTAAGGIAPFTWTFTKSATGIYTPKYLTLERRRTDGSSPVDVEVADCVVSSIRLSRGDDDRVDMEITGFGRRVQSSTLTAAQSMPTPEHVPFALSTVDIDSTWANLGVTNIAAQVLEWSWLFTTGFFPRFTADGRSDLDYNAVGYNPELVNLEIAMTLRAAGQLATEKAAAEAATLRAIQIVTAGTSSRALTLNSLVKHTAGSILELGSMDGEDVFTMQLQKASDDTNFMAVVLVNQTDALDGVA